MDENLRPVELLKIITETSPVGIVYVDEQGKITYANSEAEKVLHLSKSKLAERTYNDPQWQITDYDGHPFPDENLPFLLVKKSLQAVYEIRHAIKHEDGSLTFLSINAAPLFDQNHEFDGIVATIEDITQIQTARLEIRKKTVEAEQLFNISTPLCLLGRDFSMQQINNSFCQAFQVERDDLIGRKCFEVLQSAVCQSQDCMLKSILSGKETDSYELHRELPDKSKRDFLIQAKPYRDESGNIIGIVETFSDITREKQSSEQFETIWNVSHDLLCVADYHSATFKMINPAFRTVLGYDEAELLSRSFLEFVHPDDVQPTLDVIENNLKKGIVVLDFINRYRCQDGSYKYLQWISRPILERGETYAIARDITEQRKQRELLRQKSREIEAMNDELQKQNEDLNALLDKIKESEKTYRNIFQNAQVGLFRTRISDGKILESNQQLAKMFGYENREKFIEEYYTSRNYVDPGTREKMVNMIIENGCIENFEARFYRKDKSIFWAKYTARIFPDKGWIEGVAEDITARKLAEISLQQEKNWSENIINNAPNIIVGLGEKSVIKVFNHYAERLTGYLAEEVIGKEWIQIFIPEELRKTIYRVWAEIVENKLIDRTFENEILTKSGEKRLISWHNTILTENEEFRMILSIGEDITERKQTEEELKKHREKLEELVEARTGELREKNKRLEEFNKLFIGREFRIKELRMKIEELEARLKLDNE